jgi:hypothetical protein
VDEGDGFHDWHATWVRNVLSLSAVLLGFVVGFITPDLRRPTGPQRAYLTVAILSLGATPLIALATLAHAQLAKMRNRPLVAWPTVATLGAFALGNACLTLYALDVVRRS